MPAPTPLISVIIVCRNPGPQLTDALASVWAQKNADYEIVVIDGASTDGTREWLEARRTQFAHFVSEPDWGIYDAMNKGVASARGDWILFLGSDDRLADETVFQELTAPLSSSNSGVVSGEAVYRDGRRYRLQMPLRPLPRNFLHHQSTFYRRRLFAEHGSFQSQLLIQADYDLNLRLWKNAVVFEPLPRLIASCGPGGISDSGRWQVYSEEIRIRHRHFPGWKCWIWDVLSGVRFLRKKVVRVFRHETASPSSAPRANQDRKLS